MTDTHKRSLRTMTFIAAAVVAAAFLLSAAPKDVSAIDWMSVLGKGKTLLDKNETKKGLEKLQDNLFGRVNEALDVHMKGGNSQQVEAVWQKTKGNLGEFFLGAMDPTHGVAEGAWNKLKSAERRIKSFVRGASEAASEARTEAGKRVKSAVRKAGQLVDARAALWVDPDERPFYESGTGVLGEQPLPTPRRAHTAAAAPASQTSGWGDTNEASSVAAAAEQTGSGWGDTGEASFDDWALKQQEAAPDCWGVVDDTTDCGAQAANEEHTAANADDEGRSEYEAALADTLGEEPVATDDDDYQGALTALEAKEEERKRQARLAEQRRLEQERREREAELAEQRRLEQERREREAELAEQQRLEQERREREAELAEEEERWEEEREREIARIEAENKRQTWMNVAQSLANLSHAYSQARTDRARQQAEAQQRRRQQLDEQRRRQEAAWRQEAARQQQEADTRRRQEEERQQAEARQRAEEERRRQAAETERQRREAKEARRQACRMRLAGARTGCVQVVRWIEEGLFRGHSYELRNSCGYPIKLYTKQKDNKRVGWGLTNLGPGDTGYTSGVYSDGRGKRVGLMYVACYDAPGVGRSGSGCKVHDWACPG